MGDGRATPVLFFVVAEVVFIPLLVLLTLLVVLVQLVVLQLVVLLPVFLPFILGTLRPHPLVHGPSFSRSVARSALA
jgi:hypothetical protein